MNIPFFKNHWDEKDIELVSKVIQRGMYWANGPEITEFENKISEFIGTKFCVAFNSGTSALHSILMAYQIKDNEVIVPSFTFIASANSILQAGGKPIFCDIEERTFGLDPIDVNEHITSKTKAIMPVHYGGCPCNISEIKEIAEDNGLLVIEDAAESLGSKYNNNMLGSLGDAAMFSFTPTKVISTGEGGVIVTDHKDVYEKLLLFRSHGRLETEDYFTSTAYMDYIALGYNFRMPSICAAQGLAQFAKIEKVIALRRNIAALYDEKLGGLNKIRIPVVPKECFHIYQMYAILVEEGRGTRDRLQEYLKERDITSKVYFEPVHNTHFYKNILRYDARLATTEMVAGKILNLPIYPDLSFEEQNYIVNNVIDFFDLFN